MVKEIYIIQYYGWRMTYSVSKSTVVFKHEVDPFLNMIKNAPQNELITNTDTIYFCKNSEVPRFKLEEYQKSKNINIHRTNRVEYANTFILNYTSLMEEYRASYWDLVEIPAHLIINNPSFPLDKTPSPDSSFYKQQILYIHLNDFKNISSLNNLVGPPNYVKFKQFYTNRKNQIYGSSKDRIDTYSTIKTYYDKHNRLPKLVFDHSLLSDISEKTGMTIDASAYDQLRSMFESRSSDNIKLAMEIMANCNYIESEQYLIMLISMYRSIFKEPTRNFQSMISYLESKIPSSGDDYWRVADYIINKYNNVESVKEFLNYYITKTIKSRGIKNYTIKNIEI